MNLQWNLDIRDPIGKMKKSILYQSVPYIEVLYKSNRNYTLTHHHGLEGSDPLDRDRRRKGTKAQKLFMGQLNYLKFML